MTSKSTLSQAVKNLLPVLLAVLMVSCAKEDTPYILPPPGELQLMSAAMGVNYDSQVYVDLASGKMKSVPYRSWDLAFEASEAGFRVYLNTGKFMFLANTFSTDFAAADSSGRQWKTETEHLYDDSTAFGDWRAAAATGGGHVCVVDRGRTEHFGAARWRKIQIVSVNASEYVIRFSPYNSSSFTEFTIPKNSDYSLIYFSFENGGSLVDVAPKKTEWNIVFTKYTYTYYTEPVNSPYRHYMVTGALLNKWAGNMNEQMRKDSTQNYVPFDQFNAEQISKQNFNSLAGTIGFSWKDYDFSLGFIIYPDRYYLLKDPSGFVYKIRFLDFYDDQGNKGTARFEYKRL